MAKMHPEHPPIEMIIGDKDGGNGFAEYFVYEKLRQLPDEFHVFWSVKYNSNQIDFVVMAEGLYPVVIEVKGGLLFHKNNELYVIRRDKSPGDSGQISPEGNPLDQAVHHFFSMTTEWYGNTKNKFYFHPAFVGVMPDTPNKVCDLWLNIEPKTKTNLKRGRIVHRDNFNEMNDIIQEIMKDNAEQEGKNPATAENINDFISLMWMKEHADDTRDDARLESMVKSCVNHIPPWGSTVDEIKQYIDKSWAAKESAEKAHCKDEADYAAKNGAIEESVHQHDESLRQHDQSIKSINDEIQENRRVTAETLKQLALLQAQKNQQSEPPSNVIQIRATPITTTDKSREALFNPANSRVTATPDDAIPAEQSSRQQGGLSHLMTRLQGHYVYAAIGIVATVVSLISGFMAFADYADHHTSSITGHAQIGETTADYVIDGHSITLADVIPLRSEVARMTTIALLNDLGTLKCDKVSSRGFDCSTTSNITPESLSYILAYSGLVTVDGSASEKLNEAQTEAKREGRGVWGGMRQH